MKLLSLSLFILLISLTCYSQSHKPLEKSLLWEINGNGLKTPSYLFGTYHLKGKSFIDSLPIVQAKFNKCKAVAGEFVFDQNTSSKLAFAMASPLNTLDKVFSATEFEQISDYLKDSLHLDIYQFNELKPAALQVLILQSLAPKTVSSKNPPLDNYFQQEGRKRGDKIIGLETIDDQINLFFNQPISDQKRHLLQTIKRKDHLKKYIYRIYNLYQKYDLEEFNREMAIGDDYTQAEIDKLLKNRNIKWIKEMPEIMQKQATFIAVGAAHLVGDYGLINQLRLKGYIVKAIKI